MGLLVQLISRRVHHQQASFCCPTQAWAAAQAFVYADLRQSVRMPVHSSRYCLDLLFANMIVPFHTKLALRVIMVRISSVLYATLLARLVPKAGSLTSHQSSVQEPRLLCWPLPGVHKPRLTFLQAWLAQNRFWAERFDHNSAFV